jgi:hypothetical protein
MFRAKETADITIASMCEVSLGMARGQARVSMQIERRSRIALVFKGILAQMDLETSLPNSLRNCSA